MQKIWPRARASAWGRRAIEPPMGVGVVVRTNSRCLAVKAAEIVIVEYYDMAIMGTARILFELEPCVATSTLHEGRGCEVSDWSNDGLGLFYWDWIARDHRPLDKLISPKSFLL